MIETIRWLARLNSGAYCQIENFFRWLGCRHEAARMLGASKSSELRPVQAMRMIVVTARKKGLARVKAGLMPKDSGN
jgi:hypothetical protein